MILAIVGAAWFLMALIAGCLIGACVSTANGRDSSTWSIASVAPGSGELYVDDILRHRPAPSTI
jgi:hypothetical protein